MRMVRLLALDQARHDRAGERRELIGLAPEVGFLHRQRVHDARPFAGGAGVVLQQVVVVEQRIEAALDGQRREPIAQQVEPAVVVSGCRRAPRSDRAAAPASVRECAGPGRRARPPRGAARRGSSCDGAAGPLPSRAARTRARRAAGRLHRDRCAASPQWRVRPPACRACAKPATAAARTGGILVAQGARQLARRARMPHGGQRFGGGDANVDADRRSAPRRPPGPANSGSRAIAPITSRRRVPSAASSRRAATAARCGERMRRGGADPAQASIASSAATASSPTRAAQASDLNAVEVAAVSANARIAASCSARPRRPRGALEQRRGHRALDRSQHLDRGNREIVVGRRRSARRRPAPPVAG